MQSIIENYCTVNFLISMSPFICMFSGFAIVYFMLIRPLSKTDWERIEHELRVPRGTYENDPDVNIELRRKLKRLNKKNSSLAIIEPWTF